MKFIKYIFVVFVLAVISVFWFNDKESLSFERPIPLKFSENLREDYRKLPFTGAHNFRDLGGYKAEDGRTVKWGKIYRSDNLHSLTDEDLFAIAGHILLQPKVVNEKWGGGKIYY